jgi:hypothetical protein
MAAFSRKMDLMSGHGPNNCDSSLALQLGFISVSHFHTLSHRALFPSLSPNLRGTVSPWFLAVTSCLWEVISLHFCLLRQAWNWSQFHTRLMSGVSIPHCFLCLTWSHVHLRPSLLLTGGLMSLQFKLYIATWWDLLPFVWRDAFYWQRRW